MLTPFTPYIFLCVDEQHQLMETAAFATATAVRVRVCDVFITNVTSCVFLNFDRSDEVNSGYFVQVTVWYRTPVSSLTLVALGVSSMFFHNVTLA